MKTSIYWVKIFLILLICIFWESSAMATDQVFDGIQKVTSPGNPVKLLFIHHSVGGHWLAHENGGLVNELNKNNYYVNDITYGWEPAELTNSFFKKIKHKILNKIGKLNKGAFGIGNRTDIGHMPDWFLGSDSDLIMASVYAENLESDIYGEHDNLTSSTPLSNPNPSAENQIIMFKSCYPNTLLKGKPDDPALSKIQDPIRNFLAGSDEHTVANAKRVFNDLLVYFGNRPDKFFVIVTSPPRNKLPQDGQIAREFSNWLVHDWLKENGYSLNNIMIFDLFNILTSGHNSLLNDTGEEQGNHHRIWNGKVQHTIQTDNNLLSYPRKVGNNHPSSAGLQKATKEFVPLLNHFFSAWKTKKDKVGTIYEN